MAHDDEAEVRPGWINDLDWMGYKQAVQFGVDPGKCRWCENPTVHIGWGLHLVCPDCDRLDLMPGYEGP